MRAGSERQLRQRSGDDGYGKDGGGRRQRQRTTTTMAADNGGGQRQRRTTACKIGRQTTTGKVKSVQQRTTALGRREGEDDVVFSGGHIVQFFEVIMLFLAGVVQFCVWGGFANKEKVVHTTPSTTYLEKKQSKTPLASHFF
jgi:hypothetical protein